MPENKPVAKTKKEGPTPARKTQEAANRRPIVGDKTKAGRQVSKERLAEDRRKAREGMMRGEEKYLPARDRGPQKKLARDIVDSRFTAGELVVPVMVAYLVITMFMGNALLWIQFALLAFMWALFLIVAIDATLIGRRVTKLLKEKYGSGHVERGILMYSAMRSLQLRVMRVPKPQVKRGAKIS